MFVYKLFNWKVFKCMQMTIIYVIAETSYLYGCRNVNQAPGLYFPVAAGQLFNFYNKKVSMCFSLKNKALDVFKIQSAQK